MSVVTSAHEWEVVGRLPLYFTCRGDRYRGPAVEHWSLADVLSLSCARLVADG